MERLPRSRGFRTTPACFLPRDPRKCRSSYRREGDWDPLRGLPDPYAKVVSTLGASKHEGQTQTLSNTSNPNWSSAVLTGVPAHELWSSLRIDLFDDDVAKNDTIGGCSLVLSAAAFDGAVRNESCPASAGGVGFTFSYMLSAK